MIAEVPYLLFAFVAGMLLGLFFFGALWMTVRRIPTVRRPGLLTVASFVMRVGVTLVGFYLVMGGLWERLIACLLGFIISRRLLVRRLRPESSKAHAE